MRCRFAKKVLVNLLLCFGTSFVATGVCSQTTPVGSNAVVSRVAKALAKLKITEAVPSVKPLPGVCTCSPAGVISPHCGVHGRWAPTNRPPCSICLGARGVRCVVCGGSGQHLVMNPFGDVVPVTCPHCGGSGQVACPACR